MYFLVCFLYSMCGCEPCQVDENRQCIEFLSKNSVVKQKVCREGFALNLTKIPCTSCLMKGHPEPTGLDWRITAKILKFPPSESLPFLNLYPFFQNTFFVMGMSQASVWFFRALATLSSRVAAYRLSDRTVWRLCPTSSVSTRRSLTRKCAIVASSWALKMTVLKMNSAPFRRIWAGETGNL